MGGKIFEDEKIWNFWNEDVIFWRENFGKGNFSRDFWGSVKIFGGFLGE